MVEQTIKNNNKIKVGDRFERQGVDSRYGNETMIKYEIVAICGKLKAVRTYREDWSDGLEIVYTGEPKWESIEIGGYKKFEPEKKLR
jgi:hypothetical protein